MPLLRATLSVIFVAINICAEPALIVAKKGESKIYLFGTLHTFPKGMDWFNGDVKIAFDCSKTVVLESSLNSPGTLGSFRLYWKHLRHERPIVGLRLQAEDRKYWYQFLDSFKIKDDTLRSIDRNPTAVASLFVIQNLISTSGVSEMGMDLVLKQKAQDSNKLIFALETDEEHANVLLNLPEDEQICDLTKTLKMKHVDFMQQFDKIVQTWSQGDLSAGLAELKEYKINSPKSAQMLIDSRNVRWAKIIDARFCKPGISFVAVGFRHLLGSNGLPALLARYGWEIEPSMK